MWLQPQKSKIKIGINKFNTESLHALIWNSSFGGFRISDKWVGYKSGITGPEYMKNMMTKDKMHLHRSMIQKRQGKKNCQYLFQKPRGIYAGKRGNDCNLYLRLCLTHYASRQIKYDVEAVRI